MVCEHDQNWVDFFKSNLYLSQYTTIKLFRLLTEKYQESSYPSYVNFKGEVVDTKYESIIIDDYERMGEQHTVAELESIFKKLDIAYKKNIYVGVKQVCVLA